MYLGGEFAISSVEFHNRRDCCPERLYNLTVTVENGVTPVYASEPLNPVAEGQSPGDPGTLLSVSGAWTGDTVRVAKTAVNGSGSSEWMSFAEVVVMGSPAAPYADTLATTVEGTPPVLYLRLPFSGSEADRAYLDLWVDDGVIAWIDGVEVARLDVDAAGVVEEHEAEV